VLKFPAFAKRPNVVGNLWTQRFGSIATSDKNMSSSKKFKLTALFVALLLVLIIASYFVWWILPVTINRRSDIEFGNERIAKIEGYKQKHGLPETNDWRTLKQLGFKQRGDLLIPDYQKLNDTAYQLVYLEGFDGPYLLWNTYDKTWQKTMVTNFPNQPKEEDVVSLVEQTKLYRDKAKLIDSLSSGIRGLTMNVTLCDTVRKIYLVKVSEDNGNNLVTYLNFLVDANKMTILNPTGKLEGQ